MLFLGFQRTEGWCCTALMGLEPRSVTGCEEELFSEVLLYVSGVAFPQRNRCFSFPSAAGATANTHSRFHAAVQSLVRLCSTRGSKASEPRPPPHDAKKHATQTRGRKTFRFRSDDVLRMKRGVMSHPSICTRTPSVNSAAEPVGLEPTDRTPHLPVFPHHLSNLA